ncbi:MAG: hypothetical protein RH862_02595 [Leptospiraceae bacterium]
MLFQSDVHSLIEARNASGTGFASTAGGARAPGRRFSILNIGQPGSFKFLANLIVLLFIFSLLSCNGGSMLGNRERNLETENEKLKVSDFHFQAFSPVEKKVYTYEELPGLFDSLRTASDSYCEFIHNRKPYRKDVALNLIAEEFLSRFWRDRYWGSFHNLISGCWNFYIMNDVRPFDDFFLIRNLYPDATKHCYSVGLMQPYIMHNILQCQDLNFLDVDWRIHYAHFQLEEMYRNERFKTAESTIQAIRDLHLGWIAFSPTPVQPRHQVSPSTLCRLSQQQCLEHLNQYQKNRSLLQGITWNLSALHDADFPAHSGMPVIYLSNAIEELYTSRKQFDQLLENVAASVEPERHALFAYHAAGTDEIGLYQLRRLKPAAMNDSQDERNRVSNQSAFNGQPEYSIETICRDRYHRANTGTLKEYTTYFEKITETRNPTACSTLIENLPQ